MGVQRYAMVPRESSAVEIVKEVCEVVTGVCVVVQEIGA